MSGATPKTKIKMKKTLSICGCLCICLGFAMASGVDQNPIQAVYCLVLMAGALVCIKSAERMEHRESDKQPPKAATMHPRTWKDAA